MHSIEQVNARLLRNFEPIHHLVEVDEEHASQSSHEDTHHNSEGVEDDSTNREWLGIDDMDAKEKLDSGRDRVCDNVDALTHRVLEVMLNKSGREHPEVHVVGRVVDIKPGESFDKTDAEEEVVGEPSPLAGEDAHYGEENVEALE